MVDTAGPNLHYGDIIIIVLYFAFVLFVGLWSSRSNRGSVGGYFLAGRNMHWLPLGASLFASNVGSLHFVGLAGSGAAAGISVAMYELNAIIILIILGWLFVPVYTASGVFTMPEYLRKRFGGQRIRMYLATLSLLLYIFTKISADLFAGAIFIEQSLRWNIYGAIMLLLAIAALFTITGGLTAVIWTDFIQTIIMMIGAFTLMALGFIEVGGFEGLKYKYKRAIPDTTIAGKDTCGIPREDYMHLFQAADSDDIPWPGIIGVFVNSIWYWCADQVIVQRTLAAKNYSHAKGGVVFTGYLKILPLFLLVFPGMIARILFPNEVGCADPDICEEICSSRSGCSNIAYPTLVLNLMPLGARGMMLAVMLAALMSSLTSIFNSSSTIFTMDIWRRIRKSANDMELMVVGRVCVLVLVAISILWVPVVQAFQGSQLFVYIQQVSSFLQPPICAVYLLAIFWPRINEQGPSPIFLTFFQAWKAWNLPLSPGKGLFRFGYSIYKNHRLSILHGNQGDYLKLPSKSRGAFWALMAGLLVGGIRFILEFTFPPPICGTGDSEQPDIIKNFHYLYFAIFLFCLTAIVAVVVSVLTPPIHEKHLYRLTYWTRHSTKLREDIDQGCMVGEMDDITEQDEREEIHITDGAQLPWYRKVANWICGIEKQAQTEPEDKDVNNKNFLSIDENPKWRLFTNINAIVLISLTFFVFGFFA